MTPSPSSAGGVGRAGRPSGPSKSSEPKEGRGSTVAAAAAALAGLGAGSSLFLGFGFYDFGVWGWIALGAVAAFVAVAVGAPARPRGPALLALVGLAGMWLWTLLSTRWAESVDQAMLDSDRWLFYAAAFSVFLFLSSRDRRAQLLLAGAIAPVIAVAVYLLAKMAAGSGSELFLANRLNEPLEYVNGLAGYLLVAFWPMVAIAERARSRPIAGLALAGATALAGLTVMTQSRGSMFALAVSAAILLALVPGRTARGWALVAVAVGVASCAGSLDDVLRALPPGERLPDDVAASAGRMLIGASAAVGLVWGLVRPFAAPEPRTGGRPAPASIVLATLAVAGVFAAAVPFSQHTDELSEQYENFTELGDNTTESRLASGGGNRYDYWRVAVKQFEDDPVAGIGAGNFDTTYFRERESSEDVRNPHSLPLQVLGETGLVGFALLIAFVGGVLGALFARSRARAGSEAEDGAIVVAAGGAFLVWLAHTSVDWLHLIPGLTGIALCAGAALLGPWVRQGRPSAARGAGGAVLGGVAALLITMPLLAHTEVSSGREVVIDDPAEAVERARDALDLNDESMEAYQLEAAGLAGLGDYQGARAALEEAADREPSDYVTPALLGDLAVRRGDLALARSHYRRASELNPRDVALARLATRPGPIADQARGAGG